MSHLSIIARLISDPTRSRNGTRPAPLTAITRALYRDHVALFAAAAVILSACATPPGGVQGLVYARDVHAVDAATASGIVRGVTSSHGEAFLGIPYAAPPIGSLRFQSPSPVKPWQGVRDATKLGPECIQPGAPFGPHQSEDCLTLNVYAPSGTKSGAHLPVMVWLYGGGFAFGSNGMYDPHRLATDQNVIVVAPNYRLGVFGFLAHPALRGSGEGAFALQDQQAALRWVQANISAFGGDADNVTLFGESAGAWSTCSQLAAPAARGLFRRVILQSGPCIAPDSVIGMADAEAGGLRFAKSLGCDDPATAANCLRRLSARDLQRVKSMRRGLLGPDSWSPAVGGDVLPVSPETAFSKGDFNHVPVLNGSNRDEGRLFLMLNRYQGKLWTRRSYETLIEEAFPETSEQVLNAYKDEAHRSYGEAYADIVTDATFTCPALRLNAMLTPYTSVMAYEFDDEAAPFSLPRLPGTATLSAYHSGEIAYIFGTKWILSDPARFTPAQKALSDRMQAAWGRFAHEGRVNWPETSAPYVLTTSTQTGVSDLQREHHCKFWSKITP